MICKFCSAEVEDNAASCPACGKELTEPAEALEQAVAPELQEEPVVKKAKSNTWKKVLAIAGVVVLALVLTGAVLHFMGLSKRVLHTMKFWRPNDINYKYSYTVKNKVAEDKKDVVIATVGDKQLTNGELQAHYWTAVYNFLNYYGDYISYSGLDITKPLHEQYVEETGKSYQQMFLETALESWYQCAVLTEMAEDSKFELSEEQKQYVDSVETKIKELMLEYKYTDMETFIDEQFFPGCSYDLYMKYSNMNYMAQSYYNKLFSSLEPTQEQIEAYYMAHEADFVTKKIDKSAGNYYDVRHILVGIEGGDDGQGNYGDDQWQACQEAAQKMLDNFLANEPTEEKFADLALNNSRDPGSKENGGLYTNLTKDTGFIKDFKDWYMDESRQVGDTGLVKNTESSVQGYHIMYFSGSTPIWELEAKMAMLGENADKQITDAQAKLPMTVDYKKIVISTVDLAG